MLYICEIRKRCLDKFAFCYDMQTAGSAKPAGVLSCFR